MSATAGPQSLEDWCTFMQGLHPRHVDLSLDRVLPIAQALGVTQFDCPVITVGGTNGKGSVVTLLSAALQRRRHSSGRPWRVAATTSPHLLHINERACINDEPISDAALIQHLQSVNRARGDTTLSFFEFISLAILHYFQSQSPDVVLLEVGLGGRLDAMNVVENDCAVITSIGLDHMAFLGHTRDEIAREKSGIFKAGKMVICGDLDPPPIIAQHANKMACDVWQAGQDYRITHSHSADGHDVTHLQGSCALSQPLPATQFKTSNVATAIATLWALHHGPKAIFDAPSPAIWETMCLAIPKATLAGRLQHLPHPSGRSILVDVAHNPDAAHHLLTTLNQTPIQGHTHMLVGIQANKDHQTILSACRGMQAQWHFVSEIPVPATVEMTPASHLQAIARDIGLTGIQSQTPPQPSAALRTLLQKSGPHDRIVAWGSFHTVAAVMRALDVTTIHGTTKTDNDCCEIHRHD